MIRNSQTCISGKSLSGETIHSEINNYNLFENLVQKKIFNADENRLFFKMLPKAYSFLKNVWLWLGKQRRVALLTCSNVLK